jgi:hypothetical protein
MENETVGNADAQQAESAAKVEEYYKFFFWFKMIVRVAG